MNVPGNIIKDRKIENDLAVIDVDGVERKAGLLLLESPEVED